MVYILLSIVILLVLGFILFATMWEDEASTLLCLVFMVLALAPLVNCAVGVHDSEPYEEIVYEITGLELHSSNEQYIEGAFILGTGVVQGGSSTDLQYIFFANEQYGKRMVTLKGTNVFLRETDTETPKLISVKRKRIKEANWLDKLWDNSQDIIEFGTIEEGKVLVVPTNTIKIDYNVEI
ncbi:MAG: hypothetical protein IKB70_12585 [Bacilli bacterium]|nr:hypothetical protein [Bacilli bacterium]